MSITSIVRHTLAGSPVQPLVIREATEDDRAALVRLAQRDSEQVPAGRMLVAETGGELRAAVEIERARSRTRSGTRPTWSDCFARAPAVASRAPRAVAARRGRRRPGSAPRRRRRPGTPIDPGPGASAGAADPLVERLADDRAP